VAGAFTSVEFSGDYRCKLAGAFTFTCAVSLGAFGVNLLFIYTLKEAGVNTRVLAKSTQKRSRFLYSSLGKVNARA